MPRYKASAKPLQKNNLFARVSLIIESARDRLQGILHTLRAELSWSHYRILMRVEKPGARGFTKDNLSNMRKFYIVYRNRGSISETMSRKLSELIN